MTDSIRQFILAPQLCAVVAARARAAGTPGQWR
jgi:hypothetical protein